MTRGRDRLMNACTGSIQQELMRQKVYEQKGKGGALIMSDPYPGRRTKSSCVLGRVKVGRVSSRLAVPLVRSQTCPED